MITHSDDDNPVQSAVGVAVTAAVEPMPGGPTRRRGDATDAYPADAANRVWDTGVLNRIWVDDITYLRTWQGWLYLATVIDAQSRRVIGWAVDDHMRADLVENALAMAITLRGQLPAQVVFHSDRGTQYASAQIATWASDNGITRSMGHTGICWDCESGSCLRAA